MMTLISSPVLLCRINGNCSVLISTISSFPILGLLEEQLMCLLVSS